MRQPPCSPGAASARSRAWRPRRPRSSAPATRRGACPIRFQCAGCGFYRPDPSYLPALQEHIASLRADLETARAIGSADYVTANLAAQIDAFTTVADTMHHRLSELGSDERTEVEQASRLLRRARAGRRLPLTVNPAPTTQSG